jgi:hypothetical protein
METRNIQISIETAGRWFNGENKELKDLAVQTYPELAKKELPKSWEELKEFNGFYVHEDSEILEADCITAIMNKNVFATKKQAEASIALAQLSQLMKVYNDGWVPDWNKEDEYKHCIEFELNMIVYSVSEITSRFLSFKDEETCKLFLENFADLIEKAKPLL